jgi:ABC-type multidrug transport system ATPase subunit
LSTTPNAPSGPPLAVSLQEVTKLFGRFAALREVTAEFPAGRLYAVLGENGAGKSTLLRMMAGLSRPTRGELRVFGRDPREAARRGGLGYMSHSSVLYDELDCQENLAYFAGLYDIHDPQVWERAIAAVGLDPKLARRVGDYSQGMRQRLSLARAVLHDPQLLLLDEPFSNLDLGSAAAMAQLLGKMRDQGKTIFVVTHQPAHLAEVADESITLAAGAITSRGVGSRSRRRDTSAPAGVDAGAPEARR